MRRKKAELEEKGFIFDLYHYLWCDEDQNQNRVTQPLVNIPDTIYYKFGEPRLWFFTDKNGQVKKKMKSKLTVEKIEEDFLDRKPACNIVAFFIWTSQTSQNYRFEYFNPETFNVFLHSKSYEKEGYLQRFIQSKGEHNSIIKTIWSPTVCFHEKYQNQQQINDTSLDIYQRVINIESSRNQCEITHLKGKCLPSKISELSESIADHLEHVSVTKKKIRQMELIYKVDEADNLYLLFCQNIISEKIDESSKEFSYSIPNYINSDKIQLPRPLNLKKTNQCMNCENLLDDESVYEIDLDTIIQAWDFDHIAEDQYLAEYEIDKNEKLLKKQKESKQLNPMEKRKDATFNFYSITKNYQVPNVLRRVFPNLEYDDLINNRQSAVFSVQKITVCEECYLKVMDSAHFGQNLKNLAKYIIKSSVHKTDDLVPLKNDRIFFHKFKSKALENERKQHNLTTHNTTKENDEENSTYVAHHNYSRKDQINDNSRSKSSSMIFSSSFASKNGIDNSTLGKQTLQNYMKLPIIDSNKVYKPIKLLTNTQDSDTTKTKNNTSSVANVNNNIHGNINNTTQNDTVLSDNYPLLILPNQVNTEEGRGGRVGGGYHRSQPQSSSQPQLLKNSEQQNQQKKIRELKSKKLLKDTLSTSIDHYSLSRSQYTKLAKFYPKELNMLNLKTNTSKKQGNRLDSSAHPAKGLQADTIPDQAF